MERDNQCVTEMILDLTLEIIYLLTGEDYGPIKKSSNHHVTLRNNSRLSEWSKCLSPILEPPPPSLRPERNKKILKMISKITELLTEEVPIRCQDVSIYFSMEEWEYLEGHKDLYEDMMMEEHETYKGSIKPDGCHVAVMTSQYSGLGKLSSKTSHPEYFPDVGSNLAPMVPFLERVYDHGRNGWQGQDLPTVLEDTSSPSKEKHDTSVKDHTCIETSEKSSLLTNVTDEAEKQLELIDKMLEDSKPSPKPEFQNKKLESKVCEGQNVDDADMWQTLATNTFPRRLTENNILPSLDQAVGMYEDVEMDEGVPGPEDLVDDPRFAPLNEEHVYNLTNDSYTREKLLVCNECGECFTNNSQLVEHHRLHSTEKPFACPECGKQFADRANVIAHQLIHLKLRAPGTEHSLGEVLVVCSECGMTFVSSSAFEEHQKVHRQEKAFKCTVCDKSFCRKGHLSNHMKIHNGGKWVYTEEVKKTFTDNNYTRKRSYLCPECGKSFPSRSHLDRHQRIHTGEKPFACTECDRRFTTSSGLVIHQRIHTGEKPYKCEECGNRFRDRSGLVVHQRTHTGVQPFKCHYCGKCFHNRKRLEHHWNAHSEDKAFALHHRTHYTHLLQVEGAKSHHPPLLSKQSPETPQLFLCSECGKSFDNPPALSLHMRTHQIDQTKASPEPTQSSQFASSNIQGNDGPHSCSQCSKSFLDLRMLMAHEQQHSKEKPYKCTKCEECFVLKGYLIKHLETHV